MDPTPSVGSAKSKQIAQSKQKPAAQVQSADNSSVFDKMQQQKTDDQAKIEKIKQNIKDDLFSEVLTDQKDLFGNKTYVYHGDKVKGKELTIQEIIQRYGLDKTLKPGELKEINHWYIGSMSKGRGNNLNEYCPSEVADPVNPLNDPYAVKIPSKGIDAYKK